MYQRHVIIVLLFCLLSKGILYAQFYESGTSPTSIRWQQIHTDHFRVIFPVDIAHQGQHAANVLEFIRQAEGKTLHHYPKKIPVILHNRSVISNGFVTWAPKRSEWFLTPPQDNYAQNWLEQLAVHEYRHVVQIDKLNQGFTKALGFAIGQQGVGVVSGLLPKWFLEGDAVVTETALTSTGRGRDPAFEMPLRTIALSGKYMEYDKALFGSYRSYVPNAYELGYQMVAWTREKYNPDVYSTTIDFVGREPYFFFLYPFKLGLKRRTGYVTRHLYEHAFDDLTQRWREQEQRTGYDTVPTLNHRKNRLYTNYRSPQYVNDSIFLVQKTGMAQIAQWIQIDKNGKEQVAFTPGNINSEHISYANGYLTWSEMVSDVRWTNRSYSVIKILELQTGKVQTLQQHTRFFAPSLSPDGKTIAVVEISLSGESSIVLLDVASKTEKGRIASPDHALLQTPSWSKDGTYLLVIVNRKEGKSIDKIDIASGWYTTVLPPTYDDISLPVDAGKYTLFTGYYNGITNIYAVDDSTGEVAQVTSSRFGAFDPQPNMTNNRMLHAEYSVDGYNLVETPLDPSKWIPADQITNHSLKLYEVIAQQENFNLQDSIVPSTQHHIKPFRKWAHLFNIHSWAPLYYEVNTTDVTSTKLYPGLVLFSQDLLGNLTASAGYSWRGYSAYHASFTYSGLYPIFDVTLDYGGQQPVYGPRDDGQHTFNPQDKDMEISARTYVPFLLTRNRFITGITPQVKLSYSNSYLYSKITETYQRGLWEMAYSINIYRYLKMSLRDLAPRWGVILQAAFKHTPVNTEQLGYIYYAYGRIYAPGFAKHHSLQLSGAWQQQKTNYFLFSTMIDFPRGYPNGRTEKLSVGTMEYRFPLWYPDWNWSFFVYIKRLRANLFCDVAENHYRMVNNINQLKWQTDKIISVGIDLMADMNLLQISFPMNIGLRTVYVPELNEVQPSLLFHVNLN